MTEEDGIPPGVDTEHPSIARIYDYHLGGTHNFPADRLFAAKLAEHMPEYPDAVRENRAFLRRCVRHLSGAGVRYFLDLGSGIPTVGNVHEIAQAADPATRVVYVDNDPAAVAHSREILVGNDRAIVIQADLRDPESVLGNPDVNRLLLLDLGEPVAVLMSAVLHFVPDDEEATSLVAAYRDAVPTGSYLAISHASVRPSVQERMKLATQTYSQAVSPVKLRTEDGITALFKGFELLEPGVVNCADWRPDPGDARRAGEPVSQLCAVGRKI